MRERLTLLRPATVTNAYGEDVLQWQPVPEHPIHAERVKLTGRSALSAGERWHDYDAVFRIRAGHAVADGWRCRQEPGALYNIAAVVPNTERGYRELLCERVNE